MIMELKCPRCKSESIALMDPDYDWDSDTECIVTWDAVCGDCKKKFIVSEIVKTTSRLVAKDSDDLDRLVEEEEKDGALQDIPGQ